MRITRHKRQVLLFFAAVLAPAAVLVGLAGRMLVQERELAANRLIDQRRIAIDQVRRELSARLEAIKLQEIIDTGQRRNSDNPAVVLVARVEGDRLVLPWQFPAPTESAAFAENREAGENFEFAKRDYAGATVAYRLALASARSPSESAEAHLLLARALSKSGAIAEAFKLYQDLLNAPTDARDDQGVGYRFYALERLLAAKQRPETTSLIGEKSLTLSELYLIRSLPNTPSPPGISQRIADMEQANALAEDFARVRSRIESGAAWVPYGSEPWLVTIVSHPDLMLAVSATKIAPPGVKLQTQSARADALGDIFPGLYLAWTDHHLPETGVPLGIWIASLTLILGVALFGGYLLLRDVNRDVRMTEVRTQFVAGVSHELKTPLTAIRMFAETLAMGRSRDETTRSEYLETIVSESERLARLVDNVLDFSKIEQGRKIYRLRPAKLQEIAESAVRAMRFPLAQQGFQLHFSADENIPLIEVDPDAMQQAILNLLANAMKYSGDSREIDLRLRARDGNAVVEVVDRGLGLEPDEKLHVFDKFYRAPSHESHSIAGTGLGLTLVAHIAAAHGGRVEVESKTGVGSTFYILIPAGARA